MTREAIRRRADLAAERDLHLKSLDEYRDAVRAYLYGVVAEGKVEGLVTKHGTFIERAFAQYRQGCELSCRPWKVGAAIFYGYAD